jgi:hypothetical protein
MKRLRISAAVFSTPRKTKDVWQVGVWQATSKEDYNEDPTLPHLDRSIRSRIVSGHLNTGP